MEEDNSFVYVIVNKCQVFLPWKDILALLNDFI